MYRGTKTEKTKAAKLPGGKVINAQPSSISLLAKGSLAPYPSNHGLLKDGLLPPSSKLTIVTRIFFKDFQAQLGMAQ